MAGIESPEERAAFVDPEEFGAVAYWTPGYGTPIEVNGIFDNEFQAIDLDIAVELQSRAPQFVCQSADVAALNEGEHIEITDPSIGMDREHFEVLGIEPDGTGFTTLKLEKAHEEQRGAA